jgi:hypothetical protein
LPLKAYTLHNPDMRKYATHPMLQSMKEHLLGILWRLKFQPIVVVTPSLSILTAWIHRNHNHIWILAWPSHIIMGLYPTFKHRDLKPRLWLSL